MGKMEITKEAFQGHIASLVEKAASEGHDPTDIVVNIFSFLRDNYEYMTPDMKIVADKIIDGSIEVADQATKAAPDSRETRAAKKKLRLIKQNLPSAQGLVMSIEHKSEIADPIVTETRVLFEKYFQMLLDAIYDISVEHTHSGVSSYATLSMFFSFVDELVAGFHLAQHAYANQSYTHSRSVLEGCNLIRLFLKDPSFAVLWDSDDLKAKKKKLSPGAVRKELGIQDDPIYRFLSTYGPHTTADYVKSKTSMKDRLSEKGNPAIEFFIGGTRRVEHIRGANFNCILPLFMALDLVPKAFPNHLHLDDYMEMLKDSARDFKAYFLHSLELYKEAGRDTSDVEVILRMFDELVQ
jgi:hypothetical protein